MNEFEVNDIIHDYLHGVLSEDEFAKLTTAHPEFDWNTLLKEEQLIHSMFKSSEYEDLKEQINQDIDRIEKTRSLKKVISIIFIGIAVVTGLIYVLLVDSDESTLHIEKENKAKSITKDANKETPPITNDKNVTIETKEQVPAKTSVPATESLVENHLINRNTVPVVSSNLKDEQAVDTSFKQDSDTIDAQLVPSETNFEKLKHQVDTSKSEVAKSTQNVGNSQPQVATDEPKDDLVIRKNYIINPSFNETLELEEYESDGVWIIMDLQGEVVYQIDFNAFEALNWSGIDQYGNNLNVGLYLYEIKVDKQTVQFGQITITQ